MKIYLFFLIFLLPTIFFNSQTVVSGNVYNENQVALSGVLVVNINNDNQTLTDQNGYFLINARSGNELRFIRQNYERASAIVSSNSYFFRINITMIFAPTDIEEVKLAFIPTGNLVKDLKKMPVDSRKIKLQNEITKSLSYKQTEVFPVNKMPSDFAPRDFGKGQISLFDIHGGGIFGVVKNLIVKKAKITDANYTESKEFIKKLKSEMNKNYFINMGMSDAQLDQFLEYENAELKLSKKYRYNFKIDILENLLKEAVKSYNFKTSK